jgi:RNA polymerase sigma-70 factor (ECF subfamily)
MDIDIAKYYETYGPMVLRRCRILLQDEEAAHDAMHDVFVQLMRYQLRLRDEYPSSLLYRMATNICLNIIRDRRHKQFMGTDDLLMEIAAFDDPESQYEVKDLFNRVFENELESTRVMATLHLVDGMTLQETAGEVGLSVSGVRKRLRNLIKKAKLDLGEEP